jgi:hypothetical protein
MEWSISTIMKAQGKTTAGKELPVSKEFRKYIGHFNFWHFFRHCPDWPRGNYTRRSRLSSGSRVCMNCLYLAEKEAVRGSEKAAVVS